MTRRPGARLTAEVEEERREEMEDAQQAAKGAPVDARAHQS